MQTIKIDRLLRGSLLYGSLAVATYLLLHLMFGQNPESVSHSDIQELSVSDLDQTVQDRVAVESGPESTGLFLAMENEMVSRSDSYEIGENLPLVRQSSSVELPPSERVQNPFFDSRSMDSPMTNMADATVQSSAPGFQTQNEYSVADNTMLAAPRTNYRVDANDEALHRKFKSSMTRDEQGELLRQVQSAYAISQRGEVEYAQQQLLGILRQTATRKDLTLGVDQYAIDVTEGIQALHDLQEIHRFEGSDLELEIKVATLRTTLNNQSSVRFSKQELIEKYQLYAATKLACASKELEFGSMALCFLAKINSQVEKSSGPNGATRTFMQAALLADENNYWAANEYGVYLAGQGDIETAGRMFAISNQIRTNPQATQNLASIAGQLAQLRYPIEQGSLRAADRQVIEKKAISPNLIRR